MELTTRSGHGYHDVRIGGSGRAHLGDVHYNYGPSPDERILNGILDSLSYPGMNDRRDTVAQAHEGTFDWTFMEGETTFVTYCWGSAQSETRETSTIQMSFKAWLQDDTPRLFSFTGKPGSGKSTFMRRLASNEKVANALKDWTFGRTLIRADHWFWLLGLSRHKSLEGMLRNLLHSVLLSLANVVPGNIEAIRHICGNRWLSANTHGAWSCTELKGMLTRLSSLNAIRSLFLVDGLDECEPQACLYDLADEIVRISHLANIKICVSCRPWKVFADRFAYCPTLRLDQLTYCDMEKYVWSRLLVAEQESDLQTEIRDGGPLAKQFVWRVVNAAQGVFLWTTLATNELCIELRKGKSINLLDNILTRIPTNLKDYLHSHIFERIGKSPENLMDTAAALRLAMEIHTAEENSIARQSAGAYTGFPFSHSFVNFWLLSNHNLEADFCWKDYEHIVQPSAERMFKQTESFLREACNELLVLSPHTNNVEFFHRTVFDYLSNNRLLVERAPHHFGNDDFITELARLRCICLLRQEHRKCDQLVETLAKMFKDDELVYTTPWVSACDKLLSSRAQTLCTCDVPDHWAPFEEFPRQLMVAGLDGFICGELERMPYLAIREFLTLDYEEGCRPNLLGSALQADNVLDAEKPRSVLLWKILECGGNPNTLSNGWPCFQHERAPLSISNVSDQYEIAGCWCQRTHWEAWLGESYLQVMRYISSMGFHEHEKSCDTRLLIAKRKIGETMELLLRYGADPLCSICITEHGLISQAEAPCTKISLQELFDPLIPADMISKLRELRQACAAAMNVYTLRRNQRIRAVRSLIISEQNLEGARAAHPKTLQIRSLEGMMNLYSTWLTCHLCHGDVLRGSSPPCLATWCIDCGSLSCLCLECSQCEHALDPTLQHLSESITNPNSAPLEGHTSVTILVQDDGTFDPRWHPQITQDYVNFLKARYSIARAASVLKEYYSQTSISLDLWFEERLAEIPLVGSVSGQSGLRSLITPLSRLKRGSSEDDVSNPKKRVFGPILA